MIRVDQIGGVHKFLLARTLFGRGLYFTTAYYVDGLLIDSGCAHTVSEFVAALRDLPIQGLVNTHSHEDHVGANAELQRERGLTPRAHPLALPVLADPGRCRLRPYQLLMWGRPEASRPEPIGDEVRTPHHRFQVWHVPGHSPDHICLFEPDQGWLFTGDAYIGGRDRALRADYNVWKIIDSLRLMADLKPTVLFPASGNVRNDATAELKQKVEYLQETGRRVLDLHRQGVGRRRIRRTLFGSEMAIRYITLGHFSGKHLVRSYIEDGPDD